MNNLPTPRASKPASPHHQCDNESFDFNETLKKDFRRFQSHSSLQKGLPYKTCIASVCFEGTIWEKIDATARAGFDSIEIMTPDLDEASPEIILNYCEERDISISILQPFRDLEGYLSEKQFQEKLQQFERFVITCRALNSELILLCANCDKDSTSDHAVIIPQLRKAAEVAAKYGVRIAYENLSWAAHNNQIDPLVDIIEKVDMDNFGLCMDLFHINIHDSTLDCLKRLRDKIFFAQYCDSPPLTSDLDILEHARNYRVFPFQGTYNNIYSSMQILESVNYDGPLSLEVFNKSYKEKPGQCSYVADDALRSLVYLQASYSDIYKGTHVLAAAQVTGVACTSNFSGWSLIQLGFSSSISEAEFGKRLNFLEFGEIKDASTSLNPNLPKLATLRVETRLAFNRLVLAVRLALSFEPQPDHPLNVSNSFNLPLQSVFCNDLAVTIVISLLADSGEQIKL